MWTKVLAAISLGFLAYFSITAGKLKCGSLLLASPVHSSQSGLSPSSADLLYDECAFTFEKLEQAQAKRESRQTAVTLVSTNSSFPSVMPCSTVSGGFFTKDHEKREAKVATLNVKAAFEIFGSSDCANMELWINGVRHIVTGAINDGYSSLRVYVPYPTETALPASLLIRLDQGGSEKAENELKKLGVTDSSFTISKLFLKADWIQDKAQVAASIFLALAAVSALRVFLSWIKLMAGKVKRRLQQYYMAEFLYRQLGLLIILALVIISSLALCGIIAVLFAHSASTLLADSGAFLSSIPETSFQHLSEELNALDIRSNFAFLAFLIFAVWGMLTNRKREGEEGNGAKRG
ncbi:MAG: ABC transporter permease [Clostridiales bacterium]|nr:ABC transporter permease [Clostridiales bacterium]